MRGGCEGLSVQQQLLYQDKQLSITVTMGTVAPMVTLVGEVDATNSPALAEVLERYRPRGRPDAQWAGYLDGHPHRLNIHRLATCVDVDTGGLTFIDVSGLRVLAMPALPAAQRWIRLHNVTACQRRLLRMMGWYYQPGDHHVAL